MLLTIIVPGDIAISLYKLKLKLTLKMQGEAGGSGDSLPELWLQKSAQLEQLQLMKSEKCSQMN